MLSEVDGSRSEAATESKDRYSLSGMQEIGKAFSYLDLLLRRGNVLLWRSNAFSKEILLHLFDDGFLILAAGGIQPIFIQQHFAEIHPLIPCLLRDVVVDLLAQFRIEWWLVKSGQFFLQLDAENLVLGHESLEKNYLTLIARGIPV